MDKGNRIDLNSDVGESFGNYKLGLDEEVIPLISSANIACGFHGGDPSVMRRTIGLARQHGVAVGAHPGLPDLIGAARYASTQAAHNPDWVGSTQVFTHLADEPMPISIRPVFLCGHLIGSLIAFGVSDGERVPRPEAPPPSRTRLVGMRENRLVLLRSAEVCFAESDGNDVWLETDQGRLRAATPGMDKVAAELAEAGFLRVHRRYVVNLDRVREIERGCKGEILLIMDDRTAAAVPVSRRNAATVRRALGV